MKLMDPLLEDAKEHDWVRVSIVVVVALEFSEVDLVHEGSSVSSKDGSWLLMNAPHNDSLLHALEGHSEEEEACDLDITRQVDEDLS